MMTALCALGITEKLPNGRYRNGPEAAEQLVQGKPGYIGAMFHHVREDLYPVWHYFKEALFEGQSQWHRAFAGASAPVEDMFADPQALRHFMEGMHPITYEAAREFAAWAGEIKDIESIVDIGGASGAFLIALAQEHSHLVVASYQVL